MQYFKKGSIVPRRLRTILAHNKKAQYCITFGVDVEFDGKVIYPARPMTAKDHLIIVKPMMSAPRKNGTRQKSGFYLNSGCTLSWTTDTRTDSHSAQINKS